MSLFKSILGSAAYHKQRSHKIEALADGVFAIVMTLLVLDIRVPLEELSTESGVWNSLRGNVTKILTYMLSFSVAGQFWSIFCNQFNYVYTSDRNEIIIAMFFLMSVSLLPFSTSFLSEHVWSKVAVGFYTLNMLLILLFHTLHWLYSYHTGLVKTEGDDKKNIHRAIMKRARTALIGYVLVVVCCSFSSYLALAVTILMHIMFAFSGFFEMLHSFLTRKTKRTHQNPLRVSRGPQQDTQVEVSNIMAPQATSSGYEMY